VGLRGAEIDGGHAKVRAEEVQELFFGQSADLHQARRDRAARALLLQDGFLQGILGDEPGFDQLLAEIFGDRESPARWREGGRGGPVALPVALFAISMPQCAVQSGLRPACAMPVQKHEIATPGRFAPGAMQCREGTWQSLSAGWSPLRENPGRSARPPSARVWPRSSRRCPALPAGLGEYESGP